MKKKILLLLVLLFCLLSGCNKEEKIPKPTTAPTATPTATPTLTPVPENLAITALQNFSSALDSFQNYFPEDSADFSKGAGYDISLDITLETDFAESIGISGLDQFRIDGTIDIKDTLAAQGTLYLQDEKLIDLELVTDYQTLYYNLPEYSSRFSSYSLEAALNLPEDDLKDYTRVAFGNDRMDFLLTNIRQLLQCFQPQTGIEADCSIGAGPYLVTGEKHTARAASKDIKPILHTLSNDDRTLDLLREPLNAFYEQDFTYLQLDYYSGENNSFACMLTSDNTAQAPLVLVSTSTGFYFYSITETGEKLFCYSEITGENEGIITIPEASEETSAAIVTYQWREQNFFIQAEKDTFEFSIDYSLHGDQIDYDITIVEGGISIIVKASGNQSYADTDITLASYGQKLANFNLKQTLRDYNEVLPPTDAVDQDTWISRLNYTALSQDFTSLTEKFPYLQNLFSDKGENESNEFSDMTGYVVDADGFVDFEPLESEVYAKNQPSTGYYRLALPEDTKKALLTYAAGYFDSVYKYTDAYYHISGSLEDGIYSYYSHGYSYFDNNNFDNAIFISFDAISGELIWIQCNHDSEAEAIKMTNEVLKLLGVAYTVTTENIGYYDIVDNYWIEAVFKEEYYSIFINPYFE